MFDRLVYWGLPYWWVIRPEQVGAQAMRIGDLTAWCWRSNPEDPWLVFYHGNAGNLSFPSARGQRLQRLHGLGLNVLAIDYRGFGKSPGRPTEPGLYEDGQQAYDYALDQAGQDASKVIVYGRSLGGGVACYIATANRCRALILESTFTSVREVAHRFVPGLPLKAHFPNRDRVSRLQVPLLVIHGTCDALVPYQMGRALHQAAPGHSTLRLVLGATHNNLLSVAGAEYSGWVHDFLEEI